MTRSSGLPRERRAEFAAGLATRRLPQDVADAITSISHKTLFTPEVNLLVDYWDAATAFLKENLTVAFPAFHLRNLGSGQGINLLSGDIARPADYAAYFKAVRESHAIRRLSLGASKETTQRRFKRYQPACCGWCCEKWYPFGSIPALVIDRRPGGRFGLF